MPHLAAAAVNLAVLLSAPASPPLLDPAPLAYRAGLDQIRPEALRAWVGFLASGELAGRESGTPGYDTAARYVASELERLGVEPRGDNGTFFQDLDLVRWERNEESATVTVRRGDGVAEAIPLKGEAAFGDEPGRVPAAISWSEPWVFVDLAHGPARDTRDGFAGVDWGRHVALIAARSGSRGEEEAAEARRRGATRIVIAVADDVIRRRKGWRFQERAERTRSTAPGGPASDPPPALHLSRRALDRVLAACGVTLDGLRGAPQETLPRALSAAALQVAVESRASRRPTRNVVGLVAGGDPELAGEHVALGAHLDHMGTHDGKIHFGADDDASGVSAVLAAAAAFRGNPVKPRRSVLFLFFAAEEKGLFGSEWFAANPPVPMERIVLQVQLDMVGRDEEAKASGNHPGEKAEDNRDTLHVVGSRRHSLELDPWVQRVNSQVGLRLEYDEERVFERSDHFSFARRGVPVVFFFSGFHADYHQPTDSADKINFDKLLRVARLTYSLAFEVADRPLRLRVNRV